MTFKGTDYVIDSGLSLISKYYPESDIALERYISKASHEPEGRLVEQHQVIVIVISEEEFKKMNDFTATDLDWRYQMNYQVYCKKRFGVTYKYTI